MLLDLDSLTEVESDNMFTLARIPDRSYEMDYVA